MIIISGDVTQPTITFVEGGEATIYMHSSYGKVWAATLNAGLSTYNSCDYSINLEFKSCVGVGCFAGSTKIKLVKKGTS